MVVVEASEVTRQTSNIRGIECRRGDPNADKISNLLLLAMKDKVLKLCIASMNESK